MALKLPIQKVTVRCLLAWRPGMATLACLRVNEVARLQVCDLWFD